MSKWGHISSYTYLVGENRYRTMYGARCRMEQKGYTKGHIKAKCQLWQLKRRYINSLNRMGR